MADVIELLEHDHREVELMFVAYEKATSREENDVFPRFRTKVSPEELNKLGDHPPFNALPGPGAGLVDRLRDMPTGRAKQ